MVPFLSGQQESPASGPYDGSPEGHDAPGEPVRVRLERTFPAPIRVRFGFFLYAYRKTALPPETEGQLPRFIDVHVTTDREALPDRGLRERDEDADVVGFRA